MRSFDASSGKASPSTAVDGSQGSTRFVRRFSLCILLCVALLTLAAASAGAAGPEDDSAGVTSSTQNAHPSHPTGGVDAQALFTASRIPLSAPMSNAAAAPHPAAWLFPDSEIVNGPTAKDFDIRGYLESFPGYLKSHHETVEGIDMDGSDIVELIAHRFSVNPRLLIALLEWHGGWLTQPDIPAETRAFTFNRQAYWAKGLYHQLEWAADVLNAGFYAPTTRDYWRVQFLNGSIPHGPDDLNAGTYAVAYLLARMSKTDEWDAVRSDGDGSFVRTYRVLFGEPWQRAYEPLLPPNLRQPELRLPWADGETWWFTGGPHGGWGSGSAWGAIDFGPGEAGGDVGRHQYGCFDASDYWVRAMAPGRILVSRRGEIIQALENQSDYHVGWVLIYDHLINQDRVTEGAVVKPGDPLGHPGCEGGYSSGTHLHLARRYNGVWIPAQGPTAVPFVVSGWVATSYGQEYRGTLSHGDDRSLLAAPWRVVGQNDLAAGDAP